MRNVSFKGQSHDIFYCRFFHQLLGTCTLFELMLYAVADLRLSSDQRQTTILNKNNRESQNTVLYLIRITVFPALASLCFYKLLKLN